MKQKKLVQAEEKFHPQPFTSTNRFLDLLPCMVCAVLPQSVCRVYSEFAESHFCCRNKGSFRKLNLVFKKQLHVYEFVLGCRRTCV